MLSLPFPLSLGRRIYAPSPGVYVPGFQSFGETSSESFLL